MDGLLWSIVIHRKLDLVEELSRGFWMASKYSSAGSIGIKTGNGCEFRNVSCMRSVLACPVSIGMGVSLNWQFLPGQIVQSTFFF